MQTKCKVFSAKNCLFLHNALNVSIMGYLSNLHEKRCFCVRFALFFAQNPRFVHLFARFLHSYEKMVFPAFAAFLPLNPPFWLQRRNFPHFAHHFDARQNAKQMQMIRRKNSRKTSEKSVKIFTNPTSYRGIRKCPKTLPREGKSTAS